MYSDRLVVFQAKELLLSLANFLISLLYSVLVSRCPGEAAAAVPSPPGSPDFQFLDNPLQLWSQENELSPRAKQWQVLPPR